VRCKTTGTLISHSPTGGGSGLSVQNGGPACAALASINQNVLMGIGRLFTRGSIVWPPRILAEIGLSSEFTRMNEMLINL
jgi:hypothetical protein